MSNFIDINLYNQDGRIGDFRGLDGISHSHWPIFTTLRKMTDADKVMNP